MGTSFKIPIVAPTGKRISIEFQAFKEALFLKYQHLYNIFLNRYSGCQSCRFVLEYFSNKYDLHQALHIAPRYCEGLFYCRAAVVDAAGVFADSSDHLGHEGAVLHQEEVGMGRVHIAYLLGYDSNDVAVLDHGGHGEAGNADVGIYTQAGDIDVRALYLLLGDEEGIVTPDFRLSTQHSAFSGFEPFYIDLGEAGLDAFDERLGDAVTVIVYAQVVELSANGLGKLACRTSVIVH